MITLDPHLSNAEWLARHRDAMDPVVVERIERILAEAVDWVQTRMEQVADDVRDEVSEAISTAVHRLQRRAA